MKSDKKYIFFLLLVAMFSFPIDVMPLDKDASVLKSYYLLYDSLITGNINDTVKVKKIEKDTLTADLPVAARASATDTLRTDTLKSVAPVSLSNNVKQQKSKPAVSRKKTVTVRKPSPSELFKDSVEAVYKRIFTVDSVSADTLPFEYNVNMYKLFFVPVLYQEPLQRKMRPELNDFPFSQSETESYSDIMSQYTKVRNEALDSLVSCLLYNLYLTDFTQNYVSEEVIKEYETFTPVVIKEEEIKERVFTLFQPESNFRTDKPIDASISISKPNFWRLQGNGSLQFSQNYISPNWYKGGESSNSILSYLMFNINYNDKQKIEFDNRVEAKVGFMTVPSDTIHKYNITSDLLRLTSKLGVKAFDRWYYTIYAEFNTQFFNNYKVNTDTRVSSFMSPANLIINLGLDYKLSLPKIELSTLYSPLTYNFRYVGDPLVDPTQFGINPGEKILHSFGSTFQLNMRWTIIPSIVWESRLNYFTNYHKIETEWENTYSFVLNRYLSAKLFVHARFFDMEAEHKVQWNELFSFGINYNW